MTRWARIAAVPRCSPRWRCARGRRSRWPARRPAAPTRPIWWSCPTPRRAGPPSRSRRTASWLATPPSRSSRRWGRTLDRLVAAGGSIRDDMREVRIGRASSDPAVARASLLDKTGAARRMAGTGGRGMAVVQYVGPIKESWTAAVRKTGVQVVTYMAQNGQLVTGDDAALSRLAELLPSAAFVRAITPYTAADKKIAGLAHAGRTEVVVSTVAGDAGADARMRRPCRVHPARGCGHGRQLHERAREHRGARARSPRGPGRRGRDRARLAAEAAGRARGEDRGRQPQRVVPARVRVGLPQRPGHQRLLHHQPGADRHHRRGRRHGRRPAARRLAPGLLQDRQSREPEPSRLRARGDGRRHRRAGLRRARDQRGVGRGGLQLADRRGG